MPPREASSQRWDDQSDRHLLLSIILTHLTEQKKDSSLGLRNVDWNPVNKVMTEVFGYRTTPCGISQRVTKKILREFVTSEKYKKNTEVFGKSSGKPIAAAQDNNLEEEEVAHKAPKKPRAVKRKAAAAFGVDMEGLDSPMRELPSKMARPMDDSYSGAIGNDNYDFQEEGEA